jgi:hypothetical protein
MKTEELVVKIVLRDRLAEPFKRVLAAESGPGVATSAALMYAVPRVMQELRQEQEAAVRTQVEAKDYAERVQVEAEAYGISEETIRNLDAAGIPWRRAIDESIIERLRAEKCEVQDGTEPPRWEL